MNYETIQRKLPMNDNKRKENLMKQKQSIDALPRLIAALVVLAMLAGGIYGGCYLVASVIGITKLQAFAASLVNLAILAGIMKFLSLLGD